ncbi:hypothetical protein HDU98_012342, partial [Podochytrium sp. JEL0797]
MSKSLVGLRDMGAKEHLKGLVMNSNLSVACISKAMTTQSGQYIVYKDLVNLVAKYREVGKLSGLEVEYLTEKPD